MPRWAQHDREAELYGIGPTARKPTPRRLSLNSVQRLGAFPFPTIILLGSTFPTLLYFACLHNVHDEWLGSLGAIHSPDTVALLWPFESTHEAIPTSCTGRVSRVI